MVRRSEPGTYGAEREYRQLFGVFFAAVAVAIVVFALGVMVGEGHGPAPVVPRQPLQAAAAGPADAVASDESRRPAAAQPVTDERAAGQGQVDAPVVPALVAAQTAPTPGPSREAARRSSPPATKESAPAYELTLEGGFAVQLLAVSSRERAQAERLRVKDLGYPAYVASNGDDDLHRVRVGNYASRRDANVTRDRLRQQGFPTAWVLDLGSGR